MSDAAAAAAEMTRGFSKATFRRSMGWEGGRMVWMMRARTVQSRPPEKRMAMRAGFGSVDGGVGMFWVRMVREAWRC